VKKLIATLLLSIAIVSSVGAQSISFNLQSLGSPDASLIAFDPVSATSLNISFLPDSLGNDFAISSATPSVIDAFQGTITGVFTVTGIHDVVPGVLQQGSITPSGNNQLIISDGLGDFETASLWWNTAQTVFSSSGGVETLDINSNLIPDLSHFAYSGAAGTSLQQAFAGIGSGTATLAFSFAAPPGSLSQLAQAPSRTTDSFQGQVTAIPEPSYFAEILGAAGFLVAVLRPRRAVLT
jgi:hypothetical protein